MKFLIVVGVFALFALAYSQPLLVDMVQQNNHRPLPPVKKPMRPPISIPIPELVEIEQPQPPMMIEEKDPSIPEIEVIQEIVHNVIDVIKHQPDVDVEYFNGKVIPTPKYPKRD